MTLYQNTPLPNPQQQNLGKIEMIDLFQSAFYFDFCEFFNFKFILNFVTIARQDSREPGCSLGVVTTGSITDHWIIEMKSTGAVLT